MLVRTLVTAYAVSGACALAYQVVWYHAFVDQLGASGTTFLVVLCAFIGGLGLGARFSTSFYRWLASRFGEHGLRNYGRTELLITLAALGLFWLCRLPLRPFLGGFPYRQVEQGGLTFFVPTTGYDVLRLLLVLLSVGVPCFFMGVTFPYLCALFPQDARLPSRLYAANTLGASVAVLLTEFWGLKALGYLGCLALAATGTLCLGLYFLRPGGPSAGELADLPSTPSTLSSYPAVLSGFLCGGWQALCYVLVKLFLGPTRGVFALLAFFSILGIWLAATFVHRKAPTPRLLHVAAWTALVWCGFVWLIEPGVSERLVAFGAFRLARVSSPYTAAVVTSVAAVALLIFVPYMLWSLLLPDLCDRLQARGESLAKTYAANTLAFLGGVLLFGWVLQYVNAFYAARVFALCATVGVLLLPAASGERRPRPAVLAAAAIAIVAGAALLPRGLEMRLVAGVVDAGRPQVEAFRSSPQHLFWVRQNRRDGSRVLMFDRHSMSGDNRSSRIYMRMMAHVPLLLHERPTNALLICFGVGQTADAIRTHNSIRRLDVVDLNRDVYLLNRHFATSNGAVLEDPRLRLFCDDGRQFLKLTSERYDLVTMEPPPPLQPGISRLYSLEYYEAVRSRLAPGGLVSQWLPESQMDREGVDLIVSTFLEAFPHAFLMEGYYRDLILVGSEAPIDLSRLPVRLAAEPAVRDDLVRLGFHTAGQVFTTFMRTEASLAPQFRGGPLIRDGYTSLETIQINPVQQLAPGNAFVAFKPELFFDVRATAETLTRAGLPQAAGVLQSQSDPARDPLLPRIAPTGYFSRR